MSVFPRPLLRLALLIALLAILFTVSVAQAGGWFVITLDSLPASPLAGETLTIGFMLRQHGVHPAYWGGLSLVARNPDTGQVVRVTPREDGEVGHYTAELTLPEPGSWEWGIDVDQQQWVRWAPLTVQPAPNIVASTVPTSAPTAQPAAPAPSAATAWLPLLLALAATALFLAALQVGRRRRALGAVLGLAAAAGVMALVMVLPSPPEAVAAASTDPLAPAIDPLNEGRALFLAKGCVTCHVHAEAQSKGFVNVDIGPVLTHYVAPAGSPFLRQWLANPASLRPNTQMPDLDLSAAEIESLIAFLEHGSQ